MDHTSQSASSTAQATVNLIDTTVITDQTPCIYGCTGCLHPIYPGTEQTW